LRDFLFLPEVECADTLCNFAADRFPVGTDDLLFVCAESVPQARSTIHPALKHVVEMELLSLKVVVREVTPCSVTSPF
jgi:hypothetical protein